MRIQLGLKIEGLIVGRVKTFDSNEWWKKLHSILKKDETGKKAVESSHKESNYKYAWYYKVECQWFFELFYVDISQFHIFD